MINLVATTNTFLKKSINQASELSNSERVFVESQKSYKATSLVEIAETAHSKVVLDYGAGEWIIYTPHWLIVERLEDFPSAPNWNNFSTKLSKYFTVGEILRYDRARIPTDPDVKSKIIKLCAELDKVREGWGSGVIVTSGYRPPDVNAKVGGVSNSRHISGDAADIAPSNQDIYGFQKYLDKHWFGALGYGARIGFVHVDMRNNKGFSGELPKGVRWNY